MIVYSTPSNLGSTGFRLCSIETSMRSDHR
jgi:hypothetical protein